MRIPQDGEGKDDSPAGDLLPAMRAGNDHPLRNTIPGTTLARSTSHHRTRDRRKATVPGGGRSPDCVVTAGRLRPRWPPSHTIGGAGQSNVASAPIQADHTVHLLQGPASAHNRAYGHSGRSARPEHRTHMPQVGAWGWPRAGRHNWFDGTRACRYGGGKLSQRRGGIRHEGVCASHRRWAGRPAVGKSRTRRGGRRDPGGRSAAGRSSPSGGERCTTRELREPITPGWHGSCAKSGPGDRRASRRPGHAAHARLNIGTDRHRSWRECPQRRTRGRVTLARLAMRSPAQ